MILALPNGARISCEVTGRGDPILLLRPLGGSMALWGSFRERLAAHLRVVAFDPRGVGRSSDVPFGFTTRDAARDAELVLDALGIRRAHVFGLSLGALVGLWISPRRARSLVLASAVSSARMVRREKLLTLARALLASDAELVRAVLSPELEHRDPRRVRRILERAGRTSRRNRVLLSLAAIRHRDPPAPPARALLVYGARDRLVRPERRMALPGAELVVLPDVGHDLSLEAPARLAELVGEFTQRRVPA